MSVNRHFDGASSTSISTTTTTTTTEKTTTQKKAASSVLKLKLKTDKKPSKHIHWSEDTVDNEELNRKKSNICCIFHPNEDEDHNCDSRNAEHSDSPPAGKNVYEYQPKYHNGNCDEKDVE